MFSNWSFLALLLREIAFSNILSPLLREQMPLAGGYEWARICEKLCLWFMSLSRHILWKQVVYYKMLLHSFHIIFRVFIRKTKQFEQINWIPYLIFTLIPFLNFFQWHGLSREEQAKYYEKARVERQKHMQMYPHWNARWDTFEFIARRNSDPNKIKL